MGDLNADGRPDIVSANAMTIGELLPLPEALTAVPLLQSVSVLINTTTAGASTPSMAAPKHYSTGAGTLGVAIGDLNGDGLPDIVAANYGDVLPGGILVSGLSVLLNRTPAGGDEPMFDPPQQFDAAVQPSLICVDDVNRDGRNDLVVGNSGSDSGAAAAFSILLNTTPAGTDTLSFSSPTSYGGGDVAEGMACGDLDGDGLLDAVQGDTSSSIVSIILNRTPAGADQPDYAGPFRIPANSATAVGLGDFNRDDRLDFVVAEGLSAKGINVGLNQTAPGASEPAFADLVHFDTQGTASEGIAIADFDGDGLSDIAVCNDNTATIPPAATGVEVFVNRTAAGADVPEFLSGYTIGPEYGANVLETADINQDGKPDLILGTVSTVFGRGSINILLNTTGP